MAVVVEGYASHLLMMIGGLGGANRVPKEDTGRQDQQTAAPNNAKYHHANDHPEEGSKFACGKCTQAAPAPRVQREFPRYFHERFPWAQPLQFHPCVEASGSLLGPIPLSADPDMPASSGPRNNNEDLVRLRRRRRNDQAKKVRAMEIWRRSRPRFDYVSTETWWKRGSPRGCIVRFCKGVCGQWQVCRIDPSGNSIVTYRLRSTWSSQ